MKNFEDIIKLVTGNLPFEEKEKVITEINNQKEKKEIFKKMKISWAFLSSTRKLDDYEIENAYLKARHKISGKKERFNPTIRIVFKYAAIIVFLISLTTIYYTSKQQLNSAITTQKLSYTSFITEDGQRSKVVLPDSSIVWLNSGTTLSYPGNFSEQNRKVSLNGQAFFQVYHKEDDPFSVQANGLIVKVLGTKFDVDAYPENDKIAVVLESGKVELAHKEIETFSYTMQPGEKATYNIADNALTLNFTDVTIYSSWKNGKLIFRNESMKNVVEKLKRWYNINIEVADEEVYNSIFSGTIQNESYEEIFRYIEIVCDVHCKLIHNYEQEAKPEIIISKK
ncbi:FecR family protein [Maribellus maritimus]|uniref:FecR family protein n=1 Tax=Maribellus maritimus TaxID=2870838 RepID=UPI001EEA89AD|nr:FecR family protein [Maribellus maritimus]MCG6189700.1 FecR family protein [Maribellus maritimus]